MPNFSELQETIVDSSKLFKNKNILITGGTGSFGQAMARRLIREDTCSKVIILSRDELKQWQMQQSDPLFRHSKMRYFLGDVRDVNRLIRAFNEVHFIVHAAALKQVPAAEYNPTEFIKTNVMGAMNIIDAAIEMGVEKVIALSTDKAVNPVNLYGATKLCSDKLFVAGNSYVGARGFPKFSVVRYGNVAGSRGSIIPLWRKILEQGAKSLPITDPRMTRFWITLEQSVDLVCSCFNQMRGGEIYVPKIPSIHIGDLASALAPKVPQEVIGIRPGEKLHELMIGADDARHTVDVGNHYIILPEFYAGDTSPERFAKLVKSYHGKLLPEGFVYASDTNTQWLNKDQLRELIVDNAL